MKERSLAWAKKLKKEQIFVMLLLLGLAIVIMIPTGKKEKEKEIVSQVIKEEKTQAQCLEEQLIHTLQQVEGVGKVTAAVTLETSGMKVVEKDTQNSNADEETVYEKDDEGNHIPYVVSETTPEIRGVIVVAQGGGNPLIQQQIQEAVEALFHVDAHKIKVMKMK